MPFIGKDWRAPGENWVRVSHSAGFWELSKLRPIQLDNMTPKLHSTNEPITINSDSSTIRSISPLRSGSVETNSSLSTYNRNDSFENFLSSSLESSSNENDMAQDNNAAESDDLEDDVDDYIPRCRVKTGRSKEFIGCTSMSEALQLLDFARAVVDVRRFNYICKVVQILVNEKLQNISATARRHLFAIVQAIVLHSVNKDVHVSTARDLLDRFSTGLKGHICGSPQLCQNQQDAVFALLEMTRNSVALPDSSEDSITFLDMPREVISQILRRLPDHLSLLEAAKAHETLNDLVETEAVHWQTLTCFHFTQAQIDKHRVNGIISWRHLFFELKKYYGLREIYADLIHICCHCKSLFWKGLGHPCVSLDSPSVRVTPQQFVDMLTWL